MRSIARFPQGQLVLLTRIVEQWNVLRGRAVRPAVVGIYGLSRGGTNFIAAALHYHPRLFCVNEHEFDYRRSLSSLWRKGSIFRADGRQDKQVDQIAAVVFNKMQVFAPQLWDPRRTFPSESRFAFYLRNPIRVHLSRESFRRRHRPQRTEWADTYENYLGVLAQAREILEAYEILKTRHPCHLVTHEFFCCQHETALIQLHEFLRVEPVPPGNPRAFFRRCGTCGRDFLLRDQEGQMWIACPRHRRPVSGCGRFNPLRPIDRDGVRESSWKTTPQIELLMSDLRKTLGNTVADYFWDGCYRENLAIEPPPAARAA